MKKGREEAIEVVRDDASLGFTYEPEESAERRKQIDLGNGFADPAHSKNCLAFNHMNHRLRRGGE